MVFAILFPVSFATFFELQRAESQIHWSLMALYETGNRPALGWAFSSSRYVFYLDALTKLQTKSDFHNKSMAVCRSALCRKIGFRPVIIERCGILEAIRLMFLPSGKACNQKSLRSYDPDG
jgi:hypothetical protein